jgi:hypothetical protein
MRACNCEQARALRERITHLEAALRKVLDEYMGTGYYDSDTVAEVEKLLGLTAETPCQHERLPVNHYGKRGIMACVRSLPIARLRSYIRRGAEMTYDEIIEHCEREHARMVEAQRESVRRQAAMDAFNAQFQAAWAVYCANLHVLMVRGMFDPTFCAPANPGDGK